MSFRADPLNWLWHKPQEWRHRLRFRHNPAPGPEFEPVQDARGRTYWLRQSQSEIGEIGVWRLFYRGDQVGEDNGLRFAGEANFDVGNLEIDPAYQGEAWEPSCSPTSRRKPDDKGRPSSRVESWRKTRRLFLG